MRRTVVSLALMMSLLSVTESLAEIVVEQDRFSGITAIKTRFVLGELNTPQLVLLTTITKDKSQEQILYFVIAYRTDS